MPTTVMMDAQLKKEVKEVIENCQPDKLILDREVQINFTGDTDHLGNLLTEKEIDVVARFTYGGQKILLLFECTESPSAAGLKRKYKDYEADIDAILHDPVTITVIKSTDGVLQGHHFRDVDVIKLCFVYGSNFPQTSERIAYKEAARHKFLVWNRLALTYYRKISEILGGWTKYELFKDFSLDLEAVQSFSIKAIEVRQKDKKMYIGKIHPGQLLKIAYVVRRASERRYAYQRMLNKHRIAAIAEFIASDDPQNFLPNSVLIVFDEDPKIKRLVKYDAEKLELTLPLLYCSAWVIDGQHRAFGFLNTEYEDWSPTKFERFDLPVIIFKNLPEVIQTDTFININYFQKRIKAGLLCDLATLTRDLRRKITWASLLGRELNYAENSPLKDKVKISELHGERPIGLSSLVQYGLLETL